MTMIITVHLTNVPTPKKTSTLTTDVVTMVGTFITMEMTALIMNPIFTFTRDVFIMVTTFILSKL